MTTIFTIGFTKRSLRDFVETRRGAGVRGGVDVRLRNTSQLAAADPVESVRIAAAVCTIKTGALC